MTFDEMEQALRQRLEALAPPARAELFHVLRLPDFDRADRIGEFWASRGDAHLRRAAIDLNGARRAVVFGLLAEIERK
jgi:hypothetical protein